MAGGFLPRSGPNGWSFIWSTRAAPKVLLFAWSCYLEALTTILNLQHRGLTIDDSRALCNLH
ncbi:UNVERIFIED_CONTAM: hypothetical protein Sradi_6226900 [Sesamum radiatum]|uniref:Reverse transcriptase zinc-binding domain-containing protein n=1 Tax=Sesamum radiatum TaxID=300843 RepID=A0AAW2KAZ9_SESRA